MLKKIEVMIRVQIEQEKLQMNFVEEDCWKFVSFFFVLNRDGKQSIHLVKHIMFSQVRPAHMFIQSPCWSFVNSDFSEKRV